MTSYDAFQAAIGRDTALHAKALGLSVSTVTKWKEPSTDFTDSGAYNPADRIETIVSTALSQGRPIEDAHAPIIYLEERFGRVGFVLPECEATILEISRQLMDSIKEFGELSACAAKALEDRKLKPSEKLLIQKEGWEAIRSIALFLKQVEASE